MDKRLKNLDYLFHPRSVAFVGATETAGKWGSIIFSNLIQGGFQGKLYPVNPGRESVLGHKAYPTVRDIPGDVDLAVFTVPARQVVTTIDDCVKKGVKAGLIISAGFKEMGGEWIDIEAEMAQKARAGNMVLIGPNCQGIGSPGAKFYPWMPNFFPPHGTVAVVSQSGNVQNILLNGVLDSGFGVSKAVSSGNEADLRTEDLLDYYSEDPEVEVIVSYMEGVWDGRRFMDRARKASSKKPVVVYKGGRTDSGFAAAKSHTGAMAVSDAIFEAACSQAGLVRVSDIDEAGIIATSFLNRPLPRGRRIGIYTGGGGLGVIAADTCSELGLTVPELSKETLDKIREHMPDWWVPGNPVDMVAGLNFPSILPTLTILMESGEVDSILLLFIGPPRSNSRPDPIKKEKGKEVSATFKMMSTMFSGFIKVLLGQMHKLSVPVYVVSNFSAGDAEVEIGDLFGENRMTIYPTIETACRAIKAMAEYSEFKQITS